jgi:hypothetical protein
MAAHYHTVVHHGKNIVEGQRWVKPGNTYDEQMFSGLPPTADIDERNWHVPVGPIADSCAAANIAGHD